MWSNICYLSCLVGFLIFSVGVAIWKHFWPDIFPFNIDLLFMVSVVFAGGMFGMYFGVVALTYDERKIENSLKKDGTPVGFVHDDHAVQACSVRKVDGKLNGTFQVWIQVKIDGVFYTVDKEFSQELTPQRRARPV